MKKNILILLLVLVNLFTVSAQPQANDTALNKIRTTHIKGSKITLQSVIDEKLEESAIKIKPERYYLKKGAFQDADSIDIEVNKISQVIAVTTFYKPASTYSYEVDLFNKKIGVKGKEFQYIYNGTTTKITKWEDGFTIFEMVEERTGQKWKLHSSLYDKDLYFRKVKAGLDFSKEENSVEILKKLGVAQ